MMRGLSTQIQLLSCDKVGRKRERTYARAQARMKKTTKTTAIMIVI